MSSLMERTWGYKGLGFKRNGYKKYVQFPMRDASNELWLSVPGNFVELNVWGTETHKDLAGAFVKSTVLFC